MQAKSQRSKLFASGHWPVAVASVRHFLRHFASFLDMQARDGGRARVSRQISVKTLRRNAENVWRAPCLSYCIFYLQRTTRGIQCRGADVDKLLPIALSHPTSLSFSSFFLSLPSISTSTCSKKSKNVSSLTPTTNVCQRRNVPFAKNLLLLRVQVR